MLSLNDSFVSLKKLRYNIVQKKCKITHFFFQSGVINNLFNIIFIANKTISKWLKNINQILKNHRDSWSIQIFQMLPILNFPNIVYFHFNRRNNIMYVKSLGCLRLRKKGIVFIFCAIIQVLQVPSIYPFCIFINRKVLKCILC